MAKLNELANEYEAKTFIGIEELERIPVDIDVKVGTFDGKDFETGEDTVVEYNFFLDDNDAEVRLPNSVLGQLKAQLKRNPNLKEFAVDKEGTGKKTKYTVIPLIPEQ